LKNGLRGGRPGIEGMADLEDEHQTKDKNCLLGEFQVNKEELKQNLQEHNDQQLDAGQQQHINV
jgi:hypothetical protein